MVVCPNGSAPQTGVPAEVIIDNAFMSSLLPAGLEWLGDFLPYIPPLVFSTALFCADDPPGYPDMSLVEWAALVAGSPAQAAQESGRQVAQALYNILWYRLCECLIDATPPIGSAPTEPTDLPAFNPPDIVSRPVAGPCQGPVTETHALIPGASFVINLPSLNGQNPSWVTVQSSNTGGNGISAATRDLAWINAAGTSTLLTSWSATANAAIPLKTVALPPGVEHIRLGLSEAGNTGVSHNFQDIITVWCDGNPPGGAPLDPCCPPDATQLGVLQQILRSVTLIQRQAVPFSYVYGENHPDLVDDGELEVSGLIGVAVDVTTLPDRVGRELGTPEQIFDVGFVTLGTADGWEHSRRIDHDGTLVLPPSAGAFTRVGYTLAPDVVVAIRELVREP